MNFLKLNANQYVELVPKCSCSIRVAVAEAIQFVKENELKGADLIVGGFTMGIYPEDFKGREPDFIHQLGLEYQAYQKRLKNKQNSLIS